eukprot:3635223-Pleurochrysis_carterae.AAC.1
MTDGGQAICEEHGKQEHDRKRRNCKETKTRRDGKRTGARSGESRRPNVSKEMQCTKCESNART